jgi:hypothetical protein
VQAAVEPEASPQKTEWAIRLHVIFTLLMFVLATAYRLQGEREGTGGEPVGWQRWRRQLLEHIRDRIIVFAEGYYGIFHLAQYAFLLGVRHKDKPPGIGTYPGSSHEVRAHMAGLNAMLESQTCCSERT